MPILIEKGALADLTEIAGLYDSLCDYLARSVNYPGWRKGFYPTAETAKAGIDGGNLYVAKDEGKIVGSLILSHVQEPAYSGAPWQTDAKEDELIVIYTFAVHPGSHKKGVGCELLAFAERFARQQKLKAIRLDVYEKNLPAIRLYEKCGFRYISTVDLGLAAYGLDRFKLYEKLI